MADNLPVVGWLIVRPDGKGGSQVTLSHDSRRPTNSEGAFYPKTTQFIGIIDPNDLARSIDQLSAKHVVAHAARVHDRQAVRESHQADAATPFETAVLAAVDRRLAKGKPMPPDAPWSSQPFKAGGERSDHEAGDL